MDNFDSYINHTDDMTALQYLVRNLPGTLPVSGSFEELGLEEPDFDF